MATSLHDQQMTIDHIQSILINCPPSTNQTNKRTNNTKPTGSRAVGEVQRAGAQGRHARRHRVRCVFYIYTFPFSSYIVFFKHNHHHHHHLQHHHHHQQQQHQPQQLRRHRPLLRHPGQGLWDEDPCPQAPPRSVRPRPSPGFCVPVFMVLGGPLSVVFTIPSIYLCVYLPHRQCIW